jgi:hypothetical protein
MKTHRKIIFIGGLVLALAAALPAGALASSLLSGYGGPGQGNQAILGAALVNGPKGGGGSGNSSSPSGSSAPGSSGAAAPTSSSAGSSTSGSGTSGNGRSGGPRHSARGSVGKGGQDSARQADSAREASTSTQSFYPASERIAANEQPGTLALSSVDLLYIVLALGLLGFIGVLTRRLVRTSAAGRPR